MTPLQRKGFGALLVIVRNGRFQGSRKAAYTAAGVNSTTWTRAEEGQSVKEHTIAKIVSALFPRTNGDWQQLVNADGNFQLNYWDQNGMKPEEAGPIERGLGLADGGPDRDIDDLAGANRELRRVRAELAQVTYRLERLEEHLDFTPFAGWTIDGVTIPDNRPVVSDEPIAAHDDPDERPDDPEGD